MTAPEPSQPALAEPDARAERGACLLVLAVITALLLAALPTLPSPARYHGDEHFYTDAALQMIRSGDYILPRYADGHLRLNKPVLSYWAIVAGYKLFGVGLFASRLPSLLAGCLMVWMTFLLARALFGRPDVGVAAAALAAANVDLFGLAVRSTPDALVTLFTAVSYYGFARLVFAGDARRRNHLYAYGGAGLAIATKGLIGLLPVAFVWLFCLAWRRRGFPLRRLVDVPALLLGVVLGGFWFAIVIGQHGLGGMRMFVEDQVSEKMVVSPWHFLHDLPVYLWAPARHFFPWTLLLLPLLALDRKLLRAQWRRRRAAFLLVVGWFGLLAVIFATGEQQRTRYLSPSYPLIAAGLAAVLVAGYRDGRAARWLQQGMRAFVLIVGLLLAGLALLAGVLVPRLFIAGALWLVLAPALLLFAARERRLREFTALAVFMLAVLGGMEFSVRQAFVVSPLPPIAQRVAAMTPAPEAIGAVDLKGSDTARLRLFLGGRVRVISLPLEKGVVRDYEKYPVLVLTPEARAQWQPVDYRIEACGHGNRDWEASDVLDLLADGRREAVFAAMAVPWYLAVRPPAPRRTGEARPQPAVR